jgi:excinuclease ABC subunit B
MKTMTVEQIKASIERSTRLMNEAAKNLEFLQAAQFRDEVLRLKELLKE